MEYAIEVKNMVKDFVTKRAVDHISLTVKKGELFALLGVNGAGKTTTIRMLSGLSRLTEGDAYIMGHSIISELSEVKKSAIFHRRKQRLPRI